MALLVGFILAGEQLTALAMWATVIILGSVVVITVNRSREASAMRRR